MKVLIIDTSYLLYKSYFAYPNLTFDGRPVGAFFGFVKSFLGMIKEHNPDQVIFAGDTPKATWRHKVQVDYKAGRAEIEQALIDQIPVINEWCRLVSPNSFWVEGWEADDIIFSTTVEILTDFKGLLRNSQKPSHKLINVLDSTDSLFDKASKTNSFEFPIFDFNHLEVMEGTKANNNQILIFSADKDLYQILTMPRVAFLQTQKQIGSNFTRETSYSARELSLFDAKDFELKYDLKPCQWLDYKALVGDNGDNLKGLEGVGPKTATDILHSIGSLYHFYQFVQDNLELINTLYEVNDNCIYNYSKFLRSCNFEINLDIKAYITNPKKQKLIQKLITGYDRVLDTYQLSALHQVPSTKLTLTGFNLDAGNHLLEQNSFKSLLTTIKNLFPSESQQESLF